MKINSSKPWIILVFIWLSGFLAVACWQINQAQATSSNWQHELGVYSLSNYEHDWKDNLDYYREQYEVDPGGAFWDLMTGGSSQEYAHSTSKRRIDSEVNYHTIFPISGDGWKDWDSFDLVFFFGHNNMITPPHPTYRSHFWSNNSGAWEEIDGYFYEWGTALLPYQYYVTDVTNGPTHPSAVVYLHEEFTSALIGSHQFRADRLNWKIQTTAQDSPGGNSPGTTRTCRGGLGKNDLEWLILHGCQSVIVADADGVNYNPMGVNAFRHTWDGFHIILGHYISYNVARDLSPFADGLRTGMTVQAAYFLVDPEQNTSAISGERLAGLLMDPTLFNLALRTGSLMNSDTWTSPRPDLDGSPDLWYTKWIRKAGTNAGHWNTTD